MHIVYFFLAVSLLTSGTFAQKLSKNEIKNIIFQASKHKGKYKVKAKIKSRKKITVKKTPVSTPQREKNHPTKIAKIIPFGLAPSLKKGGIKLNQKGFVLLRGETIQKKKKNPLYKL